MSYYLLPPLLRRQLLRVVDVFHDRRPAARLIRQTAREQWKLIALNLSTNLIQALSEGATFGVIFLAVELLSGNSKEGGALASSSNPILRSIPGISGLLQNMPPINTFIALMLLALMLQLGQSIASYLSRVSMQYFAARCRALVTGRIHNQILSLSFPCASRYRVGDLSEYVGQGPEAVSLQINLINQVLVGVLMISMYLVILLKLSLWLMVAAVVLSAIIGLVQKQLLPRIRRAAHHVMGIQVAVSSRIIEDIQGLRLLHSSGQLDTASGRLKDRLRELELSMRHRGRLVEVIEPVARLLPVSSFVVIAILSLVVFNNSSVGVLPNLLTFMLALQRLNVRLTGLANTTNTFSDNSARIQRLNSILETSDKSFRRLGGTIFQGLEQEIRFENVSLRYASDLPPALESINISLHKGKTLALVGGSGAGKSSIADLLGGLYSPSSGRILIDRIDLETIDLSSWQQRLGVVSQDTFLFNASLAENIAFGCPWATRADIVAAARLAQADGFISEMPEDYDTRVGERGYRLSGGQRQRISLARAILRKPDLLILDEATSALDSESERLVQQAIEKFEGQNTVLVIAHRLSTIRNADEIVVLEKGRIVERGNHSTMLRARGRYYELWEQQTTSRSAIGSNIRSEPLLAVAEREA